MSITIRDDFILVKYGYFFLIILLYTYSTNDINTARKYTDIYLYRSNKGGIRGWD